MKSMSPQIQLYVCCSPACMTVRSPGRPTTRTTQWTHQTSCHQRGAPGIKLLATNGALLALLGTRSYERNKDIATRNKKLLGAPGLTTRSKKLLGGKGIALRNKEHSIQEVLGFVEAFWWPDWLPDRPEVLTELSAARVVLGPNVEEGKDVQNLNSIFKRTKSSSGWKYGWNMLEFWCRVGVVEARVLVVCFVFFHCSCWEEYVPTAGYNTFFESFQLFLSG